MITPCKNDTPRRPARPAPRSQHGTRPAPAALAALRPPAAAACPLAAGLPAPVRLRRGFTAFGRGHSSSEGAPPKRAAGAGRGWLRGAGRAGLNQNQHGQESNNNEQNHQLELCEHRTIGAGLHESELSRYGNRCCLDH